MGSQTLEILRQGVWASLTGGWFYDPHQDVFCNTFHLYLWLFLLCLPFTIYVYFPPTKYMWYFYCGSVAVALTAVKLLNYSLHHMYDTTDCIQEEIDLDDWQAQQHNKEQGGTGKKDKREQEEQQEGIELQVLNLGSSNKTSENELQGNDADLGANCMYELEPGLFVSTRMLGRKSLESAEYQQIMENASVGKQSSTIDLKAEVHRKNSSESSEELSQSGQPVLEIVSYHSETALQQQQQQQASGVDNTKSKDDSDKRTDSDGKTKKSSAKSSYRKLQRQQTEQSTTSTSTATQQQQKRRHSHFTTSIVNQPTSSTSSTSIYPSPLALPPPYHPSPHYHHHQQQQMSSGSVELGYIDSSGVGVGFVGSSDGFYFREAPVAASSGEGVRRIRSTALETCCVKQAGMMTVHPNSLEFIGAYMKSSQKQNPLLPPPSTRLVRNQHVMWPYYGSEIVYPIAEQSDEQQQSLGPDTDSEENTKTQPQDDDDGERAAAESPESLEELDNNLTIKLVDGNRRLNVSRESTTTTTADDITTTSSENDDDGCYDDEDEDIEGSRSPLLVQTKLNKEQGKSVSLVDVSSHAETASATSKDGLLDGEDDGLIIDDGLQYTVDSVELIASKYNSQKGSYNNSNSSLDLDLEECSRNQGDQASGVTKPKPKYSDLTKMLVKEPQEQEQATGAIRKQRIGRKARSKQRKSAGKDSAQAGSFKINKSEQQGGRFGDYASFVELDLDWLFDDENEHLRHCKEPLKRDNEWSHSSTTVSMEQDVSKLLHESPNIQQVPTTSRSLGAIPKRLKHSVSAASTCSSTKHKNKQQLKREREQEEEEEEGEQQDDVMGEQQHRRLHQHSGNTARVMKSESERCCRRKMDRHMIEEKTFNRNRSMKEGKAQRGLQSQQQQQGGDSNSITTSAAVTGLECLVQQQYNQQQQQQSVQSQPRLYRLSVSRRSAAAAVAKSFQQQHSRHHHHHHHHQQQRELQHQHNLHQQQQRTDDSSSPSSGSNHELSSLLPSTQPLLQAFLASRRDFPMLPICLPGGGGPPGIAGVGPGPSAFFEHQLNLGGRNSPPPQPLRPANTLPHGHLKRSTGLTRRSAGRGLCQRETAIANTLSAGHGTHCAKSFNDTSDGAVHCFVDEHGSLVTYTFDEKGLGTANTIKNSSATQQNDQQAAQHINNNNNNSGQQPKQQHACAASISAPPSANSAVWDSSESICNSSTVSVIDHQQPLTIAAKLNAANQQAIQLSNRLNQPQFIQHRNCTLDNDSLNHVRVISCMGMYSGLGGQPVSSMRNHLQRIKAMENTADTLNNNYPRTKSYYKFRLSPWTHVKVSLDRLKLLALLDRNLTLFEAILSIVLGVLVSVFGALMLHLGFYRDFSAFVFCFVMASCQYSLLKSVQPDAASPTHGFNKVVAYSRPIYFCLVSVIILVLHLNIQTEATSEFLLYGVKLTDRDLLILCRDFFHKFILYFPFLFSLGLFPQINTFLLYLFEQLDMHVFGGNAMQSLCAAFYCIFRSLLSVIVMYGLVFGALSEPKSSQHILFSMFCACVVSSSYHLSRSASDPAHVWNLLKKHLWPPDLYRERHRKGSNNQKHLPEEKPAEEVNKDDSPSATMIDPLPHKLHKTINARLTSDCLLCGLIALIIFGVHCSTVFTVLQPELNPVLWGIAGAMGFFLHYIVPQLRKQLPWLCIARPILRSQEYDQYQIRGPAKIMWFERVFVYLCFIERNVFYPLLFVAVLTEDAPRVADKFGVLLGSLIVVVCGMKSLRNAYSNQSSQYVILTFTALFFKYDYSGVRESFLIDYAVMTVVYHKTYEFLLKIKFVVTYIAPWQITWGSAFHAFAQPFSVPHSAMLFLQALISSILSTPLNPFLGSAIFLTSYVRPVKFWERDYNTRRVDHSNTPLSSHLERNLGSDDNNLNSIFYEHLTRSLQHSLCGDLILGRWGRVAQGDCFVLASDYLNCLVHIIEMGNGLVTFQMRGLEFRGTYCQQREVEAITEGVEENDGCCCCDPGHLPNMLSVNAAFSQRWLAWEVTAAKYILEGYSISDNSAVSLLQVYDFRKVLITYYVKSIIFYCTRSSKIESWLLSPIILKALQPMLDRNFVDLDPVFNFNIDEDYDLAACGMTRTMFFHIYGEWIGYCAEKTQKISEYGINSTLVVLCFALSLLGRRTLGAASHNIITSVEFFLYGLHALFKGDFRITCSRDEWVFSDMDLLRTVVAPGVRMSLKLHQDHFMSPDEYEESAALYEAIVRYEEELVISHEGDPTWRNAVLSGTPSLLALRHVLDEGTDEYKIIMLNKRYLSFRVIKVNRECVRGLWAGQQQELVYLRNRNPERGSIQNAKQALRNIINSSCDQPIGYPIYVSPLTTSYAETNEQLCSLIGGSVSLGKCRRYVLNLFRRIRKRCGEGCSSGGSAGTNGRGGNGMDELGMGHEGVYAMTTLSSGGLVGHGGGGAAGGLGQVSGSHSSSATLQGTLDGSQQLQGQPGGQGGHFGGSFGRGTSLSRSSLGGAGNRGSLASMGKPTSSTLVSLAGLFKERDERGNSQPPMEEKEKEKQQLMSTSECQPESLTNNTQPTSKDKITACTTSAVDQHPLIQRVRIVDPNFVYDCINLGRRIDVCWPSEYMRARGGRSHWRDWLPEVGMEGQVVHRWSPCHKDPSRRSHVDRTILLVQIEERFVPIAESGIQDVLPAQTASLIPQQDVAADSAAESNNSAGDMV